MAFNFHWSPLTADSLFYSRAQELLTTALNKSPKPPIIVDDILVNELNLGSVPPELEILEIGDLAEDRFRGIFKMCYSGDAFLTLKTRVQANPLNTYLSMKPSFTSPKPLAAASGLTIPLKITLSDIKLSAFIILVFSKQKGVTLVFRNDPLESLKVSSTFDSIPFVRDYLQKEIEGQLRYLLMEELPAIIHRLSLRLWVPEHEMKERETAEKKSTDALVEQKPIDPLAGFAQGSVESPEYDLEASELSSPIGAGTSETQSLFSQKNLVRLAALTDSHRTLSLFTPSIRDAVFRAWAGASERGDGPGANTPATPYAPSLSRSHSYSGSTSSTYVFSEPSESGYFSSRPPLMSLNSAMSGLGLGAGRHSRGHTGRKRKNRIVNLRRTQSSGSDAAAFDGSSPLPATEPAMLETVLPDQIVEEREEELITPPRSPNSKLGTRSRRDSMDVKKSPLTLRPTTPSRTPDLAAGMVNQSTQTAPEQLLGAEISSLHSASSRKAPSSAERDLSRSEKSSAFRGVRDVDSKDAGPQISSIASPGLGILERAWMAKWVGEMTRRVGDEGDHKASSTGRQRDPWHDDESNPPPAYEVQ